jgi:hypothetical protein
MKTGEMRLAGFGLPSSDPLLQPTHVYTPQDHQTRSLTKNTVKLNKTAPKDWLDASPTMTA